MGFVLFEWSKERKWRSGSWRIGAGLFLWLLFVKSGSYLWTGMHFFRDSKGTSTKERCMLMISLKDFILSTVKVKTNSDNSVWYVWWARTICCDGFCNQRIFLTFGFTTTIALVHSIKTSLDTNNQDLFTTVHWIRLRKWRRTRNNRTMRTESYTWSKRYYGFH